MSTPDRIALFTSFSGRGGVERMVVNLAHGLQQRGCEVDLLVVNAHASQLADLPAEINRIHLTARHTLTSVFALARYLRARRPAALLAAKDRAGKAAVLARALARVPVPLWIRIGTTVSAAVRERHAFKRWWWHRKMRWFYPRATGVIAVSAGVASDIRAITGLDKKRVRHVPNPVIGEQLFRLATEAVDHPWLGAGQEVPVVMGAGRFTRQKDFPVLIRAFARLRERRACRLVIVGEGRDRAACMALAQELGISRDCFFPGHLANPWAWMARAGVFCLSSRWEGSPNVLTEALALGVPVVGTDCPSGPREILDGGRVAPLVPVGDVEALAAALAQVLERPPGRETLTAAVRDYTILASTDAYLRVLVPARSCRTDQRRC